MSARHTSGPWLAATAGSSIVGIPVVGPKGRAITSLNYSPAGVPGRDPYNAEQLANAQLIACAPQLLDALRACADALEEEVAAAGGDDHPTIRRHAEAAEHARAVIAKAEGGSCEGRQP